MAIDDGAVVDMEADALGEGHAFAVAAQADQIDGRVKVLHAVDLLFDDGSGIELAGDVVAGGSDQFYPALVGLPVGIRADEGGQETVEGW